jgi:hypothetical protein
MSTELQRQLAARKERLARFAQAGNPKFDRPINLRRERHEDLLPPPRPIILPSPPKVAFQAPKVTLPNNSPARLPLHIITIQGAVCEYFGITRADLIGTCRLRRLVRPRQIAMFLAKEFLPQMSFPQIGKKFGGRDHTTTLYGVRTINTMIKFGNVTVAKQVDELREIIRKTRGEG